MPLMLIASSGLIAAGVPPSTTFRCQFSSPLPAAKSASGETNDGLQIGSPVVIVQAPPTLKTAVPMPSLKVNNGQVKAGDVGREDCIKKTQRCVGYSTCNRHVSHRRQAFQAIGS